MDPASPGIQRSVIATQGQSLPVDLLLEANNNTLLSVYSISLRFDKTELEFLGDTPITELLPSGSYFHITPDLPILNKNAGHVLGQISSFEAATHSTTPINGLFHIGTVDFRIDAIVDDDLADIIPGRFSSFDRVVVTPPTNTTFMPGYIIPEPSSLFLLAPLAILAMSRRNTRICK